MAVGGCPSGHRRSVPVNWVLRAHECARALYAAYGGKETYGVSVRGARAAIGAETGRDARDRPSRGDMRALVRVRHRRARVFGIVVVL